MQRFLQIIKHTQVNKTVLVLALGYMVVMAAVVMTTPTNASFTSQTTLKGQMVMGTEVTERGGTDEGGDDKQDNDDSAEALKQDNDEATDKLRSSDDETEEASESDDETEEASETDDEKETAPDESE